MRLRPSKLRFLATQSDFPRNRTCRSHPKEAARQESQLFLRQSGWIVQDWSQSNLAAGPGDEIRTLVVEDKWLAALEAALHGEMDRVSRQLTQRVKELAKERYETPLPEMASRVVELESKVDLHLERMGFSWK